MNVKAKIDAAAAAVFRNCIEADARDVETRVALTALTGELDRNEPDQARVFDAIIAAEYAIRQAAAVRRRAQLAICGAWFSLHGNAAHDPS